MRVQFSIPVKGVLKVLVNEPISWDGWSFFFKESDETGFVDELIIELLDIPQEHWPTLIPVEQDPDAEMPRFPFDTNPDAVQFRTFKDKIINLESLLSVYGVEEFCFEMMSTEWIFEEGDEHVGILGGFEPGLSERQLVCDPLSPHFLSQCVVASNQDSPEVASVAHFRVGMQNFFQGRHIEAIRSFYICIEALFANNKTKKTQTLEAFSKSPKLLEAILESCLSSEERWFRRLQRKYPLLADTDDPNEFCKFLFSLRGSTQHANGFKRGEWHPSLQKDFEDEAVCLMNLCHEVCWQIVEEKAEETLVKAMPVAE